jgi:LacI family transcriptional regulator
LPNRVRAPNRVTIRDVAGHAGVSIGTASKALNGKGKLRAETRNRVILAAEQLMFTPNPLARGLLGGRTSTVGLITNDQFGRLCAPVTFGAEDVLGARRVSAFICDSRDDRERERQYVELLLDRRVDGVIIIGHRIEPRPGMGADLGMPLIYAMAQSLDVNEPAVIPDDFGGGRAAAVHLISSGRRRLAHITGPQLFLAARKRASGFCQEAAVSGVRIPADNVLYGEWSEQWGREAARIMLQSTPDLDGFFCGNDQIARGVSETLRQLGRTIPDDVALVGFDNWEPVVLGADPPLTSVDMCLEDIGRKAAELLLAAVSGERVYGVYMLPCRLVMRDSSVPGRQSGSASA